MTAAAVWSETEICARYGVSLEAALRRVNINAVPFAAFAEDRESLFAAGARRAARAQKRILLSRPSSAHEQI